MKRVIYLFVAIVLSANFLSAQQLDSLTRSNLGGKIDEYFTVLEGESLALQMSEADFMIEISPDSLIRQFTACRIFDHFVESPVMGSENVAVYVFDKWFADGRVKMDDEISFMNAKIFADFNRQSLLGEKAPQLRMQTFAGDVYEYDGTGERYSVLFFYDTSCAKCKVESILLRNFIETEDFPVDYHAIYSGDNRPAWEAYVSEQLSESFIHLWDPELDSDFQRKYGIIQTPRMFLIAPDGTIIGRGLDTPTLSLMLHNLFDEVLLNYGSDESTELFDGIFKDELATTKEDVIRIADYIEESTLGQGNAQMFRQLTGDLLYYLSSQSEEAYKEGAAYLIDKKILTRNEIWTSSDDSLKVIGLAQFMSGLLEKSKPGTVIADLKVSGERLKSGKSKKGNFRLDKLRGHRNLVIFYTEGCKICDEQKAIARKLASTDRGTCVLLINVDEIYASDSDKAGQLFEVFDLSSLPFLLETDKNGVICRRYIIL